VCVCVCVCLFCFCVCVCVCVCCVCVCVWGARVCVCCVCVCVWCVCVCVMCEILAAVVLIIKRRLCSPAFRVPVEPSSTGSSNLWCALLVTMRVYCTPCVLHTVCTAHRVTAGRRYSVLYPPEN